jgi:hypothetical protein
VGGVGCAALVSDSRRRVMDLMTRVWLRRLFWALVVVAATWVLVGRG